MRSKISNPSCETGAKTSKIVSQNGVKASPGNETNPSLFQMAGVNPEVPDISNMDNLSKDDLVKLHQQIMEVQEQQELQALKDKIQSAHSRALQMQSQCGGEYTCTGISQKSSRLASQIKVKKNQTDYVQLI